MLTDKQKLEIVNMAMSGTMFYSEIAEASGVKVQNVRHFARVFGLPKAQKKMGQGNIKHSHLHNSVLIYFLTHSFDETAKHFKLTKGELKSCMSAAYRDVTFRHLRKDTRTQAPWTTKQLLFLLRHSGLRPRKWIAEKLKRGNAHSCIKERLQKLGVSSRTLNGFTLSQFRQVFQKDPGFFLRTDAGPQSPHAKCTLFKIVPWIYMAEELKSNRLTSIKPVRDLIYSMAFFQDWIFQGNAIRKMKRICKHSAS